jgi:4-hydroxy-tetrahydrodipicolinate synthase
MTVPRTNDGVVEIAAFAHHMEFLLRCGITGFALNGATGEYCLTSPQELGEMLRKARELGGADVTLLSGIGGAGFHQVSRLLETAQASGADGLLLPMPHFFPYGQGDLDTFVREVAQHATLPVLLYDLPGFTTPLNSETVLRLVQELPQIIGLKDSSGSLLTLHRLKASVPGANCVVGNDSALFGALSESVCDGVVSGVACVLPELMQAFYREARTAPHSDNALALKGHLDRFIEWLGQFPVPWGLKIIAEERRLSAADFPFPLSPESTRARSQFIEWFRASKPDLMIE